MAGDALQHLPVLLPEVLSALAVRADGIYLDGTFGRGGHAAAVLERLGPEGRLLATDKDPEAVGAGRMRFAGDERFEIVQGSFTRLAELVEERGWRGRVAGILLDLGVSSPQLDDPERGFSFRQEGPLDMRMDPTSGVSAADWLARAEEGEIATVLKEYGEERFARRIARAIVRTRESGEAIQTTGQLAEIIARANPSRERKKHPATRSFQALRIYVNRELEELDRFLEQSIDLLAPGGRLAVISFHSLEDRRVKRFIRHAERGHEPPPGMPVPAHAHFARLHAIGRAVRAGEAEVSANPRARSAVLRVAERPA